MVWIIYNQDGTASPTYAPITTSTGNSATIKTDSSTYASKYVVLKAMLLDDETVYKEFIIQLRSLF